MTGEQVVHIIVLYLTVFNSAGILILLLRGDKDG